MNRTEVKVSVSATSTKYHGDIQRMPSALNLHPGIEKLSLLVNKFPESSIDRCPILF